MQLTSAMVRALRGAPLTVLVLMMIERTPLGMGYLRRHTGYTDKVVHDSVLLLNDYGLVTQTGRYTWQIAAGVKQLPLMEELPEPEESAEPIEEARVEEVQNDQEPETIEAVFTPEDSSDEIRSELFRPKSPLASSINQNLESRKDLNLASSDSSEKIRANLEILDQYQIRNPARKRLAELEHVTPQLIDYHCSHAPNPALAIYRIQHNWKIPEAQPVDPAIREYLAGSEDPEADFEPADELQAVPETLQQNWDEALNELACSVSRAEYDTWVNAMQLAGISRSGTAVVHVANSFAQNWLEAHAKHTLESRLGHVQIEVGY